LHFFKRRTFLSKVKPGRQNRPHSPSIALLPAFIKTPDDIREFKEITTAGATMAAVTEKVWGEYVSAVCQILSLASKEQYKDDRKLRSSKSLLFSFSQPNGFAQRMMAALFAFLGRADYF